MLTLETQKRIASLFECIAENERQVEVVRQVLSEQEDFDPHAIFAKISGNKSHLIRKDITDFLDNYSVRYLPQEMNQLFYNYNGSKEKMSYTNFLKMVLPNSSHFLRQLKVELIPHRRKVIDVTYELEWALIRVFEKELQLYRVVEVQKEEIVSRWDFKISAAFRCISQKSSKTHIEHGDLQNFIDLMSCSSTSDDILNILRRCDHDKDGKISQLDLELSLTPYKKYKTSLIQQAMNAHQQEKKQTQNNLLTGSAVYNNSSSSKKRSFQPQQANSAQRDRVQPSSAYNNAQQDPQKQTKSRSYSYQNSMSSGSGFYPQSNEQQMGQSSRSNQKYDDANDTLNKTPRRQNSTDKMKQSNSIQRNSGNKKQLPQSSSQEFTNNNSHVTPTKMKTISYSNTNYNNQSTNGNSRGHSISNGSTATQGGFSGSHYKQGIKNASINQNIDPYRGGVSSNQTSNKKPSSNSTSDYKGAMNSSSGMKSYQNQNSNSSKVNSKLKGYQNTKENLNNSFLNYKEELKNQIRNEIIGQQQMQQRRNNSSAQSYNNTNYNHDNNFSNIPDQQYQQQQYSQQQQPQKVLLLSNYHQNTSNSNQPKYENSSNKRYGELKQKLVDELNNSLVLSEKNSPTTQIYKKMKENLYSNSKSLNGNHSSINYESSADRKNGNQYGREFKQKLREEMLRSSQDKRYSNGEDLASSKYTDPYAHNRFSPSPVRVIKVDVKDIDPLKQNATSIQSDKYSNPRLAASQPPVEKKLALPSMISNNQQKEGNKNSINIQNGEDINAVSRYYPSAEKQQFMQTQHMNRDQLGGIDSIKEKQESSPSSHNRAKERVAIPSPVRTSYQDNMKDYYLEKNRRQEIEEELQKQMKIKQVQQQQQVSRQSSYSPYQSEDIMLRKQSMKEQQIIDQIEFSNQARNAELRRIKEIEEQQLRELEAIKQKQYLMEEERLTRLKKQEELRKQQIEEELFRREKMKKEQEEIERLERFKRERERVREQEEKMQVAIKERVRIDEEIRMKQLKSQKIERDVHELERQLAKSSSVDRLRQSSADRIKQYSQQEDFRREQEIQIKQRELEKTRLQYEQQIRPSVENSQRSPYRYMAESNLQNSSLDRSANLYSIDASASGYTPAIQLKPVSLSNSTTPQQSSHLQKTDLSVPHSNTKSVHFKPENNHNIELETKIRLAREIEEKRIQLELENQRSKEAKFAQEKQRRIQQGMEEALLMDKKQQELQLIEEMQRKRLQELEMERYKNEQLREIEEADNQRILALEKDLSYTNLQKGNRIDNSFKAEESPMKAYEVVSKSARHESNKSSTPNRSSSLNKSINGIPLSSLETQLTQILKFIIDSSNEQQNIKENLAMRADFTLSDAFRLMDVSQKGLIELPTFEQFLKNVDVHSSQEAVNLLFTKICPRNQKYLKKEEVDQFFKPISQDHSAILSNRVSLYNPRSSDFAKFSFETKDIISQLFKSLLSSEQRLEELKQEFMHSREFKLDDAYFLLDKEKNGAISHDDLKKVLNSYHLCVVDKDIKYILSRFDRYQRGKITFEDFRQEILPH